MSSVATDTREYVSPVRKLVKFFHKSRDKWKAKCQKAKRRLKVVKHRVRVLEDSRDAWKAQVGEQRRRIAELEVELQKTGAR